MRKLLSLVLLITAIFVSVPRSARAAGGIYASGGGTKTVGQTFTVTVAASGATFDTIHGAISISGPVSVTSFSAGDATWISRPSNGGTFDGAFLGDKKTSFTVATIKLKATGVGSGAVSVSGASLKNAGTIVGTGAGSASYTIQKAPDLPGAVNVTSSSHPDQNAAYEATAIVLTWDKASGVDTFSYLLDQAADTTPAAKTTDALTTITYPDKVIGTYYFHIRAHKPDGWGGTTHFKINIKEPDAKIDVTLSKPSNIKIEKSDPFTNGITDGTVTGIIISGTTEPLYTVNLTLAPAPTIPEGKKLSAVADADGKFSVLIDYPIVAGFHKLTIQGQKEKVLTPITDLTFEISQAKGGTINILTDEDANPPAIAQKTTQAKNTISDFIHNKKLMLYALMGLLGLIIIVGATIILIKRRKSAKIARSIRN